PREAAASRGLEPPQARGRRLLRRVVEGRAGRGSAGGKRGPRVPPVHDQVAWRRPRQGAVAHGWGRRGDDGLLPGPPAPPTRLRREAPGPAGDGAARGRGAEPAHLAGDGP